MPVLDAYEATARLQMWAAGYGQPRRPLIALTANVFASDRERCLAARMSDLAAKPVQPEALFKTVLMWLAPPH